MCLGQLNNISNTLTDYTYLAQNFQALFCWVLYAGSIAKNQVVQMSLASYNSSSIFYTIIHINLGLRYQESTLHYGMELTKVAHFLCLVQEKRLRNMSLKEVWTSSHNITI